MTEIEIHEEVFNKIYLPWLQNYSRIQIYFGGSSSGKSVFIAQRVIWDLLNGGRNYLVCRQVARTIRGSVATEIGKVITAWNLADFFSINKTDGTITCIANGYQVVFVGLDDVEKLKSIVPLKGSWTDVWIEEATEIDKASIKQLLKRQRGGSDKTPKRLTMSFNPIMRNHWIFAEYFAALGWADDQKEYISPELSILKTIYKDNKFLTHDDVHDLESEKDTYYRDVYTLGNWGVLGDVIFTNWVVADLLDPKSEYYLPEEQRTNRRNGLDFGFSSDPAALGVSHYDKMRKRIYFYKELYETGLTNDVLAERVKEMIGYWRLVDKKDEKTGEVLRDEKGNIIQERVCEGTENVVCDSAEPKSIQELCNHGVNAIGAKKGKDSIEFGIDWLRQQEIVIDKACINMQNELQQYQWKKDAGGNSLKIPIDKNNHLIDGGLRYAYENDMEETWYIS